MIRGEKFELDLDESYFTIRPTASTPGAFVGDILERKPATPSLPTLKSSTGFPEHRKRTIQSRFKQRSSEITSAAIATGGTRQARAQPSGVSQNESDSPASDQAKSWEEEEKQRIAQENEQKLAHMSPAEIEDERRELMNSLSPALLQRLLQRSNVNSGSTEIDLTSTPVDTTAVSKPKPTAKKMVSFAQDVGEEPKQVENVSNGDDPNETEDQPEEVGEHGSLHFPQPTQPPDLDPSSKTFLQDLHQKYFPSLPSDPDKLQWMQESTNSASKYDPTAVGLKPKDIRFSFKGELIPPRLASEIPVTAGLHHHGDAPDAAGYTITELVHLGHSSFAPQRCVAFQTLGRLLYRLGKGEFGDAGEPGADIVGAEDTFGELARGLWGEVEREKVLEMLAMESEGRGVDKGKHVSARSYATEALWLWQKGGGRRWKAG